MTGEPHGIAIYCDDIRPEIGGKYSLIGVYTGNMNIAGQAPTILPKFGVHIIFFIPAAMKPESVSFHLFYRTGGNRTQLAEPFELKIPQEAIENATSNIGIAPNMVVSPVRIDSAGAFEVEVVLDGHRHVLNALPVEFVAQSPEEG